MSEPSDAGPSPVADAPDSHDDSGLSANPHELAEKYRREREKRMRSEGTDQYLETTDAFLNLTDDPYAEPGFSRDPIEETVDVVIVGGGLSGLLLGARLHETGIDDVRIIEKAADFGGTWYWNRYPGLACDIESYIYMPLLEELGYIPTERYAKGAEIYAHIRKIADEYDLYLKGVFQTVVTEMRWDAGAERWIVSTNRGDRFRAKFVITAGGPLHKPKLPDIPGLATFKGRWFHTSRWDYDYTGGSLYGDLTALRDKRVGLIGTGATAIQCLPHLAASAKHVYVFQRTPSSVDVRANRPTDPEWAASLTPGWQQRRRENFNAIMSGRHQDEDLVNDGWTYIIRKLTQFAGEAAQASPEKQEELRQLADFQKMEETRARVASIVKDPVTAESLKPYYDQYCKRPAFHDEYLQAFNRDNVTLVDTQGRGVERITETGLVALGQDYPLDCIIFATGFEFEQSTDYTRRLGLEVYGRDGVTLTEKWRDGALTLHGMHSHGFPNYFICSLLQAGLTPNLTHVLDERAKHLAHIIGYCKARGVATVEATQSAEAEWVETIVSLGETKRRFDKGCTPGYLNNEGKQTLAAARNGIYPDAVAFLELLKRWRDDGDLAGLDVKLAAVKPAHAAS